MARVGQSKPDYGLGFQGKKTKNLPSGSFFALKRCCGLESRAYRGTSLITNSAPLGPYSRNMPRALWWSWGGVLYLMRQVSL